jgi:hypothetical protein
MFITYKQTTFMKIFFLIFLFLSFSLCAQDSTSTGKRNIIKPHILFSVWKKLLLQTNYLDIEFERGLNKKNSITSEIIFRRV